MKNTNAKTGKFEDWPENLGWSFALINGRLAELHFDTETKRPWAHCYVDANAYTTKKEQRYIKEDTKKARFSYRKGVYKLLNPA